MAILPYKIEPGTDIDANQVQADFEALNDAIASLNTKIESISTSSTSQVTQVDSKITSLTTKLESLYPVGAIYITTAASCPMSKLISGSTWTLVSKGCALWTGNGKASSGKTAQSKYNDAAANTTIAAGLPNIKGKIGVRAQKSVRSGAFTSITNTDFGRVKWEDGTSYDYNFDANDSCSIYNDNYPTVQPPAYVVNVYRRTK